jgi:hypothetical protein
MSVPAKKRLVPVGNRHTRDRTISGVTNSDSKKAAKTEALNRLQQSNPHLHSQNIESFTTIKLKQPTLESIQRTQTLKREKPPPQVNSLDDTLTKFQVSYNDTRQRKPYFYDTGSHLVGGSDSYKYYHDTIPGGSENFLSSSLSYPLNRQNLIHEHEEYSKPYEESALTGYHTKDLNKTLSEIRPPVQLPEQKIKQYRSPLNIMSHQWTSSNVNESGNTLQERKLDSAPTSASRNIISTASRKPLLAPVNPPLERNELVHWSRLPEPKTRYGLTIFPDTHHIYQPLNSTSYYSSEKERLLRKTVDNTNFLAEVYQMDQVFRQKRSDAATDAKKQANDRIDNYVQQTELNAERKQAGRNYSLASQTIAYYDALNKRDRFRKYTTVEPPIHLRPLEKPATLMNSATTTTTTDVLPLELTSVYQ